MRSSEEFGRDARQAASATLGRRFALLGLLLTGLLSIVTLTNAGGRSPSLDASYLLPDVPLAQVQSALPGGTITNDRGMFLGGVGSDLWRGPGDGPNEYQMLTDRGPNGQIRVSGVNRRTFPVPEYTPLILHVRLNDANGAIEILDTIPIVGQSGAAVTGLSNLPRDERPYDYSATVELALYQSGLDSEGLVRMRAGEFWVAEEYGPSLAHIDPTGMVIARYTPQGVACQGVSLDRTR